MHNCACLPVFQEPVIKFCSICSISIQLVDCFLVQVTSFEDTGQRNSKVFHFVKQGKSPGITYVQCIEKCSVHWGLSGIHWGYLSCRENRPV